MSVPALISIRLCLSDSLQKKKKILKNVEIVTITAQLLHARNQLLFENKYTYI